MTLYVIRRVRNNGAPFIKDDILQYLRTHIKIDHVVGFMNLTFRKPLGTACRLQENLQMRFAIHQAEACRPTKPAVREAFLAHDCVSE